MANQETGTPTRDGSQPSPEAGLLADAVRLNWLNDTGRVAKFSDGWNAWSTKNRNLLAVDGDIRKAIDAAMQMSANTRSEPQRGDEHEKP
jgi:hypothetical protein